MSQTRKILMAGGTFSVALGIGFVMQNGDALAGRFAFEPAAATDVAPAASETVSAVSPTKVSVESVSGAAIDVAMATPLPEPMISAIAIPRPVLKPAIAAEPVQLAAADADAPIHETMVGAAPVAPTDCMPTMTAVTSPAAMVTLALSAPCSKDTPFVVHHQGMMFSALTDADGLATITVPALNKAAVFIAAFDDSEGAFAVINVPDIANYDRAVLQWHGRISLEVHALENGASYGSPGHVWAQSPRDADVAIAGDGGFLVRLGDTGAVNPLIAEVYTYPVKGASDDRKVDLSVEAEITDGNCGREVAAQSIQIEAGSDPRALDLTMTMPACEAVGDFLVLKNMFDDIQVASR